MRFGILIFLSFIFTANVIAQPLKSLPREMMLEVAEEQLEYKDYYHALEWFEKAYEEERELSVAKQIADIHLKLRDYRKAESWYKRVIKQDKLNEYPQLKMQYAQLLKINGKYEEALPLFATVIDSTDDQNLIKLAYNEIKGIEAYGFSPAPADIIVEGLARGVNSSFSEYSPNIDNEGNIYFSSYQRKNVIIEGEKDEDPNKKKTKKKKSSSSSKKKNSRSSTAKGPEPSQYANIYTTTYDEKKKRWNKPTELGQEINRPGYHTSNVYVTEDGRRMYFTRAVLDGNEVQESKIHVSFKDGSGWGPSVEVQGVNGNFLSKAPVVGDIFGAEVMFFASNMDGGKGGDDIYYASRISDKEFGIPTNLGESINTPGNEATPFFKEAVLYFSSDGHPGLGGFDIFKSSWNGAQFEDVENMGKGYNTSFDDHFYRLNTDGSRGFLVSNRPGTRSTHGKTCCDDIFEVKLREFKIDLLTQVLDEEGPLPGATVTLVSIENNDIGTSDSQSKPDSSIFRFPLDRDIKYRVDVSREGYYPGSYEFNTVGLIDDQTIKRVITLEPIPKPKTDPNDNNNNKPKDDVEIITTNTPIRMSNIYYDLDDAKILPDAETDLYKILGWMERYSDMVIELSSHTDSQGRDKYNDKLSQRRADSAKRWLVDKGVDPNRIQAVGYGEQFILNRCTNNVNCSDDEHRFNRRTEFKIISGPQTIEVKKEVKRGAVQGNSGIVAPPKNYKLTFDKEKISLGRVRKGTKKSHTYKFQNTGDEPIEIELITSCDCTTITWDEGKVYQPGEMGEVKVTFDSTKKNKSETLDVDVILKNNDPATGYPMIYILQFAYELVK